jgi:hypothetical protein
MTGTNTLALMCGGFIPNPTGAASNAQVEDSEILSLMNGVNEW